MNGYTAKTLAEELLKLPPDTPVFVRGYEDGVNSVVRVEKDRFQLFVNTEDEWWVGQHDRDPDDEAGLVVEGVELVGDRIVKAE